MSRPYGMMFYNISMQLPQKCLVLHDSSLLLFQTGQFVSDFGGAMGLWMGASALTIIELVDLVFRLCHRGCCQKGKSKKKSPGDSTPPEGGGAHRPPLGHLRDPYHKDYAMDNVSATPTQHRLPRLYAWSMCQKSGSVLVPYLRDVIGRDGHLDQSRV